VFVVARDSELMAPRDAEYRRALGLAADEQLPAALGTVGGSRGGHTGRINQATTGRPAEWHTAARKLAAELDPDRAPAKRKKRRRAKAGRARLSQTIGSAVPGAGAELHARLAGQQNAGPSS